MRPMGNAAKILARMRNNPRDWRIEDLKVVANHHGIDHDQPGTSHVTFRHPRAGRLPVPADRPIQPVYVRKFVNFVDCVKEVEE
jgi:hypothetical protein